MAFRSSSPFQSRSRGDNYADPLLQNIPEPPLLTLRGPRSRLRWPMNMTAKAKAWREKLLFIALRFMLSYAWRTFMTAPAVMQREVTHLSVMCWGPKKRKGRDLVEQRLHALIFKCLLTLLLLSQLQLTERWALHRSNRENSQKHSRGTVLKIQEQRPGDAALFSGLFQVQMPFPFWQLHLWMIHLTNRLIFKCICSEEAVVLQTGTFEAADIFTAIEKKDNVKEGAYSAYLRQL